MIIFTAVFKWRWSRHWPRSAAHQRALCKDENSAQSWYIHFWKSPKKNRRLFAFLREHHYEIFDDECQNELEAMYRDTGAGKEALCPARMAMALIVQGYLGISDAEAVELLARDISRVLVIMCL